MTIEGVGIHSGRTCRVRLHRDEGPLRFRRGRTEIAADVRNVVGTDRCTTLGRDGARVAMVEHLLAALRVAGWWRDVVVEADEEELPILDGSAQPWQEPIAALGDAPPAPEAWTPDEPVTMKRGESSLAWKPGPARVCGEIAFDHPAIGHQTWCGGPTELGEVLSARTFGFLAEADALRRAGLARGASTERAIVFAETGPLVPLRVPDEPVRHKVLDLVGDLALLGRPLGGSITAIRGSHALHVAFMEHLRPRLDALERRSA